jgi:4-phosphopantoate--beta-alanine ligase
LIAHGRGEAFDYILGEKSGQSASKASAAASAYLLSARNPVLSVNGNTAALVGKEIVQLASMIPARIEVNLFHRTLRRERVIARYLARLGATKVLGVGAEASTVIPDVSSPRANVDPEGIGKADVVFVPLEDGDRVEALQRLGKQVIAIDLNPLSRTSRAASVTIVDNVVRAVPELLAVTKRLKISPSKELQRIKGEFNNQVNLGTAITEMVQYLRGWLGN